MEKHSNISLIDHEEYMNAAGKWGKYQKIISLIVIITTFHVPIMVLTLPMNQKVPMFQYNNGSEITWITNRTQFCSEIYYSENFELMQNQIIVDTSFINWSSQLKIVCNTKKIFSMAGTIYFIASLAAYIALSKFPDRYGRRNVFLFLNLFALIAMLQLLYLFNFVQILIASFVLGLCSLNLAIESVILNENIDGNKTAFIMGLGMSIFPLGGLINTVLMYFICDWRYYFGFVTILLFVNNYLGFTYMKESPKWLLANHRNQEYFESILFIASVNGNYHTTLKIIQAKHPKIKKRYSLVEENSLTNKDDYRKIVYDITDLFKYKSLRLFTICNIYLWIITGFSFYGILLSLEGLTGNIFIDSLVSYSAEFIAEVGSGVIADSYGRQSTIKWSFIFAAIGCGFFPFAFNQFISIPLLFISCIGVASSFNVLYIYSAEMYPTNIKSLAVGVFFVSNRLFAAAVPIILTYFDNFIFILFIMNFISIFIMNVLPETLNKDPGDEVKEVNGIIYDEESTVSKEGDFVYFNEVFDETS